MNPVKWYLYTEETIPNLLTENSIYFCTDTNQLYFDYDGRRNNIHPIPRYLINDVDRFNVFMPDNYTMYIIINSGRIWLYVNEWVLVTPGVSVFFEYPNIVFKRTVAGSKEYNATLLNYNSPTFYGLKIMNLINIYSDDLSDTGVNEFLSTHTYVDTKDLVSTEVTSTSVIKNSGIITATVVTTDELITDEIYGRVLFCSDEFDTTVVEELSEE